MAASVWGEAAIAAQGLPSAAARIMPKHHARPLDMQVSCAG
jgi:hypothetical protein